MRDNGSKVTIHQVAEKAGVSIGTVDRILHDRGRVSQDTKEKVLKVIQELGFKPNIHASLLSVKKTVKIAIIIPYFQSGEFWSLVYNGIQKAIRELPGYKLDTNIIYYNQFDEVSFNNACRQCISLSPDGVILSPIHKEASARFVDSIGVPAVFLDTCVDNCDYFAYYGIDLFDSAYLAADLLFSQKGKISKVVNFNIKTYNGFESEAFVKREQGFAKYIKDHKINCEILRCTISPSDFLSNVNVFDKFFQDNPDVHHAITMTSRAHIITDWMDIRNKKDISVIGYDMTPANILALSKGSISYLIAQRTDLEAYLATKALLEYLTIGQRPARKDNLFPIDILTRHNVKYYIYPTF